jgi:hypothetical protein
VDYDDGLIACSDDALIIRRYDALLHPKRIPYGEIRAVTRLDLGTVRRWRLWGTTDPRLWFNLDWNRRNKSVALILDTGKRVKPVITPDDPKQVIAVLRQHDLSVTT